MLTIQIKSTGSLKELIATGEYGSVMEVIPRYRQDKMFAQLSVLIDAADEIKVACSDQGAADRMIAASGLLPLADAKLMAELMAGVFKKVDGYGPAFARHLDEEMAGKAAEVLGCNCHEK